MLSFSACNCSDEVENGDNDGVGDAGGDAVGDASGELDTEMPHDGDLPPGGDTDVDEPWDDDDCPTYQVECDGECIPASVDPDNCGGCGVSCSDDQACSGGVCIDADTCLSGEDYQMTACDRQCVDTRWDEDHCGQCDNACADGSGCSFGTCHDVVEFDGEPEMCEDGGPPIFFGEEAGEEDLCAGDVASTTFRWGLCSCESVIFQHDAYIDGFDSSVGPYVPGGYGGGVGANESIYSDNRLEMTGTIWSAGTDPLGMFQESWVGDRLYTGGDLEAQRELIVERHGYVLGDVDGDPLEFGGTLHLSPDSDYDPDRVSYDSVERDEFDIGAACTECEPEDRIDIASIVEARGGNNNDNDVIGLDEDLLNPSELGGETRIDLPCGNYYLSGIDVDHRLTIVAHGNTALYIDGDVHFDHRTIITPTADAELDVFVAGDVTFGARVQLGSPNYPALMRVYVGGDGGLTTDHRFELAGFLYSVPGGADFGHRLEVFGGLYTQDYDTEHRTAIHFDRRILTVGDQCPDDDPDDPPDETDDVGVPDDADADIPDDPPDDDDPCRTQGNSCEDSGDCCTPLECTDGTCQLEGDCVGAFESCEEQAECCFGLTCTEEGQCEVIP